MRISTLSYAVLLLCFTLMPSLVPAQCSGGTLAGNLTPTAAWQPVGIGDGTYFTFTVPPLVNCSYPTYYFSLCAADGGSAGFDSQLTILNGTTLSSVAYNDDGCGLQSTITFTPTAAGVYRVLMNSYYCADVGNTATMVYRMVASGSTNPNFSLSQSATNGATSNCVQLTANATGQRGCAWNNISNMNFGANFSYDFTVNLGSSDAGADGIAFVLQNDPDALCTCGDFGGAMGAANILNSLMVEIDTYMNYEDRDDFCGGDWVGCTGTTEWDHLDIWTGTTFNPNLDANCDATSGGERPYTTCAVALKSGAALYNIENGSDHVLRISWTTGAPGTLTARVMNTALSTTYGTISYSFNPMTIFGTNTPYFGFTGATGGLSNQQTFCVPAVLLPTAMQSFTAQQYDQDVMLKWNTEDERYLRAFRVERSYDMQQWEAAGSVNAAGNGAGYSLRDPVTRSGKVYYRLVLVQDNGTEMNSEVREVYVDTDAYVSLSPNPGRDLLYLDAAGLGDQVTVRMFNAAGQQVFEAAGMAARTVLPVADLAPGLYTVQVSGNGQQLSRKWMRAD